MSTAARIMWEKDCGAVPVVDPTRNEVVGIITDRDICMAAHMRATPLSQMRVADAMREQPHVCRQTQGVRAAHTAMRQHQVRRLPVVDNDNHLVGIVTLNDLALSAARKRGDGRGKEQYEIATTLEAVSQHRTPPAAG